MKKEIKAILGYSHRIDKCVFYECNGSKSDIDENAVPFECIIRLYNLAKSIGNEELIEAVKNAFFNEVSKILWYDIKHKNPCILKTKNNVYIGIIEPCENRLHFVNVVKTSNIETFEKTDNFIIDINELITLDMSGDFFEEKYNEIFPKKK